MNQETLKKRQDTIKRLKQLSLQKTEANRLIEAIKQECGILIDEPENASSYQINRYNALITGSDLYLPLRRSLLMQ